MFKGKGEVRVKEKEAKRPAVVRSGRLLNLDLDLDSRPSSSVDPVSATALVFSIEHCGDRRRVVALARAQLSSSSLLLPRFLILKFCSDRGGRAGPVDC